MRWYQMHAGYFGGRFQDRKDVIVINDAFDVLPKVAALWGQYRAKLHETYIRFSVRVNSNPRVRLTTNTSAARYTISALETPSLEEAIAAILGARAQAGIEPSTSAGGPRRHSSTPAAPSYSSPPSRSSSGSIFTPAPPSGEGPASVSAPRSFRPVTPVAPSSPPIPGGASRGRTNPPISVRSPRPVTAPPTSTESPRVRTQPPGTSKVPPKANEGG
jgi:hypothetical protein